MKLRKMPLVIAVGAGAVAVAVAPITAAANLGATDVKNAGVTITQQDGHVHIAATPPPVSEPRSYGEFPTAAPFLYWD